jgi:hypothetical protein
MIALLASMVGLTQHWKCQPKMECGKLLMIKGCILPPQKAPGDNRKQILRSQVVSV